MGKTRLKVWQVAPPFVFFRHCGGKGIEELFVIRRVFYIELNRIFCVVFGLGPNYFCVKSPFGCRFCGLDRLWLRGLCVFAFLPFVEDLLGWLWLLFDVISIHTFEEPFCLLLFFQ